MSNFLDIKGGLNNYIGKLSAGDLSRTSINNFLLLELLLDVAAIKSTLKADAAFQLILQQNNKNLVEQRSSKDISPVSKLVEAIEKEGEKTRTQNYERLKSIEQSIKDLTNTVDLFISVRSATIENIIASQTKTLNDTLTAQTNGIETALEKQSDLIISNIVELPEQIFELFDSGSNDS